MKRSCPHRPSPMSDTNRGNLEKASQHPPELCIHREADALLICRVDVCTVLNEYLPHGLQLACLASVKQSSVLQIVLHVHVHVVL